MPQIPDNFTDELAVVIPYKRLCELLTASQTAADMKAYCDRLEDQITALRGIQTQCLEKIRDIEKFL